MGYSCILNCNNVFTVLVRKLYYWCYGLGLADEAAVGSHLDPSKATGEKWEGKKKDLKVTKLCFFKLEGCCSNSCCCSLVVKAGITCKEMNKS